MPAIDFFQGIVVYSLAYMVCQVYNTVIVFSRQIKQLKDRENGNNNRGQLRLRQL